MIDMDKQILISDIIWDKGYWSLTARHWIKPIILLARTNEWYKILIRINEDFYILVSCVGKMI